MARNHRYSRTRECARHSAAAVAATLALLSACTRDAPLPTAPGASVITPSSAILEASVTSLPFTPVAINDAGQIAGTQQSRAVLYTPGPGMQNLGTLGGDVSVAYGLNELGQVVGMSTTALGEQRAFLWTPGIGMQDLGTLPGAVSSTARGINDRGQVVGEAAFPPCPACRQSESHAFVWADGPGMQDLGLLSQDLRSTVAYDINNAGQVVGRAFTAETRVSPPTDPEYLSRAFLWSPGQGMRDLGDLGGGHSIAHAINDAGQVVGRSWLSTPIPDYGLPYHAFVWTADRGMHSLGTLTPGPSASVAYDINEAGQVVGTTDTGPFFLGFGPLQGFLWTVENGMDALAPTTNIRTPRGVNDRQQVIGDGRAATVQLASGNTPPIANPGGPYSGVEGSPITLTMSATDIDDVGFRFMVRFGDGREAWFYPTPLAWRHTYADNGTYALTVTAFDNRGAADTKATTAVIANVAPAILPGSLTGPTAPLRMSGGTASAPIALEFRDPAGRNDTYAAEIACGNGVVLAPTNIPVSDTYLSDGTYSGTGVWAGACPYTLPGVYTVRATVSDEDGGTSAPAFVRDVVVYDPEGGDVKGNGFYAIAGQRQHKAHFVFDAGFTSGAAEGPNGSVRFWVQGGTLTFESTTIEMLVVQGSRAQFWGTGTLDGRPARFRITAVDARATGGDAPNAVRVELWNAAGTTVLYDSQPGDAPDATVTTPLGGGTIRVRGGS